MAKEDLHLTQARHNKKVAKYLLKNNCIFPDWAIICAFYVALHCFEARLYARENEHTESLAQRNTRSLSPHAFRNNFILRNHRVIYKDWKDLYDECKIARYLSINISKPAYEYFSKSNAEELIKKMDIVRHHFGYQF